MAKTKATPTTNGRIGRATLEKIQEVQLDFNEKLTTIQVTLGNLVQNKDQQEELKDKLNQMEGQLQILAGQIIGINQGTANALQVMDAQLNQMASQQMASYQQMNQAPSSGMANQYQRQAPEEVDPRYQMERQDLGR
tara:strand:+ start:38 stop:448 length:411 start_codon:yes stop_codon:yes gene_type:complete